jgi:sec-independent protein translocase protein TatA
VPAPAASKSERDLVMTPTVAVDLNPLTMVIIFAIVVLLFGASRIPGLGKSVGQSIRGFKSGLEGDEDEHKKLEGGTDAKPPDTTPKD